MAVDFVAAEDDADDEDDDDDVDDWQLRRQVVGAETALDSSSSSAFVGMICRMKKLLPCVGDAAKRRRSVI